MPYQAPTREQRFVLDHVAGIGDLAKAPRFAAAQSDMVDAIVEGVGQFAQDQFAPIYRIGDTVGAKLVDGQVRMPPGFADAYRAYVDNGWGTISAPVAFGGQGLPVTLAAVSLESLGGANMAFALCPTLTVGAVEALMQHGTAAQQALYLPHLATGAWTGTMNLTEPQAGSDVGALRTQATPLGDDKWKIKGTKIFISFGDHDLTTNIVHLVLARTPDAPPGTKGISLFLVPKYRLDADGQPGAFNDVRPVALEHKMGIHASPTCVLSFGDQDDCIGERIGPLHGGMRAMFTMMNNARLNIGLQGVQAAEASTQKALAFAVERIQSAPATGGRDAVAIIRHPDVRRMLMRARALTQAARAITFYAFGQLDRSALGDADAAARCALLTPLVKAYATDIGEAVSSLGMQVHGGMGYIEETGAAQYYRDIRIAAIYEGTNGIQAADFVGRKLSVDHGAALFALLADIRSEAADEAALMALVDAVEDSARWSMAADVQDRLAGSYPLLTMSAVAVSGWLMARQHRIAAQQLTGAGGDAFLRAKHAITRYYLDIIVPEAMGLVAATQAGAGALYALDDDMLAG